MEGKELADAIKLAAFVLVAGGIVSTLIWKVVGFFSKKDRNTNKAYNRGLEDKITAQEKLFDTKHDAVKEDVTEVKTQITTLVTTMGELTTEIKVGNGINKKLAESNERMLEKKDDEIKILKKDVNLHEQQIEINHTRMREEVQISRNATEDMKNGITTLMGNVELMIREPPVAVDLMKFEKDIKGQVKVVRDDISVLKKENPKKDLSEISERLKSLEARLDLWDQFTDDKFKEKLLLTGLKRVLSADEKKKIS